MPDTVEHVIAYSDSCSGQNKNNYVLSMFLTEMQNHPHIKTIDHKFLVPGNTHMECDSDHAVVEKAKKREGFSIQQPENWYNIVRETRRKNPFNVIIMDKNNIFDYESLYKLWCNGPFVLRPVNIKKKKINWYQIRWIRYVFLQIYFNSSFETADFMRKDDDFFV